MPVEATKTDQIPAGEVHTALGRHMLVDGLSMVLDLEKSHGAWLHDARRGRDMLDFFTCYATVPLGYNHPGVVNADFQQRILPAALNKPSNSDLYTTYMAEFVESLSRILPEPLSHHLFFIEGGALAVENALKTAFDWKVRKNLQAGRGESGHRIVHFRQAFHGRSGYTLSLTNTADPRKTDYFPRFDWPRISNPKLVFPITAQELERVEAAERQAIEEIERALAEHPHEIAALIIEPIQGEGGDNHFRGEFLRRLRELADEAEMLLIFDEIQTGFGSTGKWWCCEHFDMLPDILVFGKKSQVCGIAVSRRVDEVDSVFKISSRINSTWGGNLVDMVRCQRFIEIIDEDGLLENAARVGERLLAGLRGLAERFPERVTNVRGRGLMLGLDLPDRETRDLLLQSMSRNGLVGLRSGPVAVRFRPPLILREDEADEGVRRLETALAEVL